jgi:hypothetical protein
VYNIQFISTANSSHESSHRHTPERKQSELDNQIVWQNTALANRLDEPVMSSKTTTAFLSSRRGQWVRAALALLPPVSCFKFDLTLALCSFVDIVTGVDPSKFSGGTGRIGEEVMRRGLGFGADGRPVLASSGGRPGEIVSLSLLIKNCRYGASI